MTRRCLALLPLLALCACATDHAEPSIQTVEVKVPVAVPCVAKDFPAAPVYPDTREALKAAQGQDQRYRLLAAGWPLRDARLAALEGQVAACR